MTKLLVAASSLALVCLTIASSDAYQASPESVDFHIYVCNHLDRRITSRLVTWQSSLGAPPGHPGKEVAYQTSPVNPNDCAQTDILDVPSSTKIAAQTVAMNDDGSPVVLSRRFALRLGDTYVYVEKKQSACTALGLRRGMECSAVPLRDSDRTEATRLAGLP